MEQIPTSYSTRMRAFSRGSGDSIHAALAYRHGVQLERASDRAEPFDYRQRGGVGGSVLVGWDRHDGESLDAALQRLADHIHAGELTKKGVPRANAVLGREVRCDLPDLGALERTHPDLCAQVRAEIMQAGAEWWHQRTGVVVTAVLHTPDEPGERDHHAHLFLSPRVIRADGSWGERPASLNGRDGCPDLDEYRAYMAARCNEVYERAGVERRVDPRGIDEIYAEINQDRAARGLEAFEAPRATLHEGPAVTAARRRAEITGEALDLDLVRRNDAIRAANDALHARNQERMSRDWLASPSIRELRAALSMHEELARLWETGARKEARALRARIPTTVMAVLRTLPAEQRAALRKLHPAADGQFTVVEDSIRRAERALGPQIRTR